MKTLPSKFSAYTTDATV